jgi:hypothetical protein
MIGSHPRPPASAAPIVARAGRAAPESFRPRPPAPIAALTETTPIRTRHAR